MQSLASTIRGTVGLGTRHHTDMVYLDAVINFDELDPPIDRGMSTPLLASAMGNAWLAAASPAEREQALNLYRVREPDGYARQVDRHSAAVKEVRNLGYCTSTGHRLRERFSVAAALNRPVNGQIVVFNCTVRISDRTARGDLKRELGPRLLETIGRIEAAAGMGHA